MEPRDLCAAFRRAHDRMRDIDGLAPQEAFDELLKYLLVADAAGAGRTVREIRSRLPAYLAKSAQWTRSLWPDRAFHLSDAALEAIHDELACIPFSRTTIDCRSAALRTFLTPEIRRGLGIFLTPEDVVRMMVEVAAPQPDDVVLDPACGAGTFLVETVRFSRQHHRQARRFKVLGIDKNPRMLLLAGLNLGNGSGVDFEGRLRDALDVPDAGGVGPLDLQPDSADVILTNPPFGVTVKLADSRGHFRVATSGSRVSSEILFVEQCLHLLKPGGTLGIVLPRSVFTNRGLETARRQLDALGHLTRIVSLPPETFALTGTQTTTVVAFFRKHAARPLRGTMTVASIRITNVGHDATGRPCSGNQLPLVARPSAHGKLKVDRFSGVRADQTLQRAAGFLSGQIAGGKYTLGELIAIAATGKTPPRSAYTDQGMFILKVGNLTGRGIDWTPRDRNFVSAADAARRQRSNAPLILDRGDIVLTSSAHSPRYIASKVDIVVRVPPRLGPVTFVGELMLLRCKEGIDPYCVLAYLRLDSTRDQIQRMIRGQTAHLSPDDLLQLSVPINLIRMTKDIRAAANLLRKEARLAYQLSEIAEKGREETKQAFAGDANRPRRGDGLYP